MDTRNATDGEATLENATERSVSWWEKPVNYVTLGWWGKRTPGEKRAAVLSWNVSSWVTVGQVTGGAWLWGKLTAAVPWFVPLVKGVWTKLTVAVSALFHALTHA